MKKLIGFIALLITVQVQAQKNFEGIIKYKVIAPEYTNDNEDEADAKKDSMEVIIFLSPKKIKIIPDDKETIVIYLDSSKIYTINNEDKEYTVKKLKLLKRLTGQQPEIIAGYRASPVTSLSSPVTSMMTAMAQLWIADSLFYHLPPGVESNEELMFIQDNRIVLKALFGMDMSSSQFREGIEETNEFRNEFMLIASSIIPQKVNPNEFIIPEDYAIQPYYNIYDSAMSVMDTLAVPDTIAIKFEEEKQEPPPPAKKNPTKKPTNARSPARKD